MVPGKYCRAKPGNRPIAVSLPHTHYEIFGKSVRYSGMVFGIGIDVVENDRISDSIRRHGQRFVDRVFHTSEIDYCRSMQNPAPHFAARFAAKEAVSKAFGTGFAQEVSWRDIEISRKPTGEPFVILHGGAAALADRLRISSVLISLSHTENYAVANALLMTDEQSPRARVINNE